MVILNNMFFIIKEVKKVINCHILDKEEFYKVYKSDFRRYIVVCKDSVYKFRIRASLLIKKEVVITIFIIYSCSPVTHYKNK